MKSSASLRLAKAQIEDLERMAEAAYPYEGCGLLLGMHEESGTAIHVVTLAENLNRERAHDRYELNPEDMLQAELHAEDLGYEVLGIWHTHPDQPAIPSETDRAAAWEGWSYLIVSVARGRVHSIRSWRLSGAQFTEEILLS